LVLHLALVAPLLAIIAVQQFGSCAAEGNLEIQRSHGALAHVPGAWISSSKRDTPSSAYLPRKHT
jgi:hypothetical protein